MDLMKIGKMIAELRREQGLTQEQLGEKLGVTNKTVSRWETGAYLPPVEILLLLSQLFGVSINELLSGKRLSREEYVQAAEENLKQTLQNSSFTVKEKLTYYKTKWLRDHAVLLWTLGIALAGTLAVGVAERNTAVCAAVPALLLAAHAWRNNAMMAYAERHAYPDAKEK